MTRKVDWNKVGPELLEAARVSLSFVQVYIQAGQQLSGTPKGFPAPYALETMLKDAIAKAEGRAEEKPEAEAGYINITPSKEVRAAFKTYLGIGAEGRE